MRPDTARYAAEARIGSALLAGLICLGAAIGCVWGALTWPHDRP